MKISQLGKFVLLINKLKILKVKNIQKLSP